MERAQTRLRLGQGLLRTYPGTSRLDPHNQRQLLTRAAPCRTKAANNQAMANRITREKNLREPHARFRAARPSERGASPIVL